MAATPAKKSFNSDMTRTSIVLAIYTGKGHIRRMSLIMGMLH